MRTPGAAATRHQCSGVIRVRTQPETEARNILDKHQVLVAPVPIDEIAAAENVQVVRHRSDGPESGFVFRGSTRRIIGVNSNISARGQRFAIAHELGHLVLRTPPLPQPAPAIPRAAHRCPPRVPPTV
jgi:Zn-dependent peptidase ImmA (M78 family)